MFLDEVAERPKVTLVGELVRASAEVVSKMEEARERAREEAARQEAAEQKREQTERRQEDTVVLSETLIQLTSSTKTTAGEQAAPQDTTGATVNVTA